MKLQFGTTRYSFYAEIGHASHRRCIDGKITGENKCFGFCEYQGHSGFLTRQHIIEHRCREKECFYFQYKDNSLKKLIFKNESTAAVTYNIDRDF